MKIYRAGNTHYATQDEAKKASKALGLDWAAVELSLKLRDLIAYLNSVAEDAQQSEPAPAPVAAAPAPVDGYADRSVSIDHAWADLPLAHKLSFGALALEEARAVLPHLIKAADANSVL